MTVDKKELRAKFAKDWQKYYKLEHPQKEKGSKDLLGENERKNTSFFINI
jgi:hypothetical protein